MNENIIEKFNPCDVSSYPLLSKQMTLAQAAVIGTNGIIKKQQLTKTYKSLQGIAEKSSVIIEYIKTHETAYHRNYRFDLIETAGGSTVLNIILLRLPKGAKAYQRVNVNIAKQHNPHWQIVFDQDGKLVSCGSFSNQSMQTNSFNQYDDMCIHQNTYHHVNKIIAEIIEGLSDEPVEIELKQSYLDRIAREKEKAAAKKEKERLKREKQKAKEKAAHALKVLKEKERQQKKEEKLSQKNSGKKEEKYFLPKPDGSKVEVTKEVYEQYQAKVAEVREQARIAKEQAKKVAEMEAQLADYGVSIDLK